MFGRLEGKVALVTGADGGIGGAIVRRFIADGANVLATGEHHDALGTLGGDARSSGHIHVLAADLRNNARRRRLCREPLSSLEN